MAQQTRKWNPGDAANIFVRVILSDAGALLGGLHDDEWDKTRAWFDGRCAYTGEEFGEDRSEQDHAVPMNRAHCGLHLFGNVLPATRDANRRKAGKHYLQLWVTRRAGALPASGSSSPSILFSRRFTMTGARRTGADLCRCRVVPAHVTREKNDDTAASAHAQ